MYSAYFVLLLTMGAYINTWIYILILIYTFQDPDPCQNDTLI